MSGRLAGKIAIITGTGGAMGRLAALRFAAEGAKVVGCDFNEANGAETLRQAHQAGGNMVSVQPVDLGYVEGAKTVLQLAIETYGGVDILYNNAAMAYFAWVADMSYKQFNDTMREEVDIIFHLTQLAWPYLIASGHGAIVNIASGAAVMAMPDQGGLAHCGAKAAVVSMTRQYAAEGARHNLRCNSVSPGWVVTPQTEVYLSNPEWVRKMLEKRMLKRPGKPEEMVNAALFLASDEASYVTGANLAVDGGSSAM